jgi:hypothetical protein
VEETEKDWVVSQETKKFRNAIHSVSRVLIVGYTKTNPRGEKSTGSPERACIEWPSRLPAGRLQWPIVMPAQA